MISDNILLTKIKDIQGKGYTLIYKRDQTLAGTEFAEFEKFRKEWNNLGPDNYLPNNGKYRQRCFSKFHISTAGQISVLPPTKYFQSTEVNKITGGIEKIIDPIPSTAINNQIFKKLLLSNFTILNRFNNFLRPWEVSVHFFRVLCNKETSALPTPGGLHKDGVDFVTVQLMERKNITGGISRIADNDKNIISQFTLLGPLDRIVIDDKRLMHDASEIFIGDDPSMKDGHRIF
ncbi:MAG: 2OG-Fe dioxygenase family protein [Chitinophagaceae bacterium]|nr:2OG-Fe dioxygenase family protein [Chitinophagaceae bacterium]